MASDTAPEIPIGRFEIYANGLDHPECLAFDVDGFLWAGGEAGQVYRIAPDRSVDIILFASHAGAHGLVCPNYGVFTRRGDFYVTDSGAWNKRNGFLLRFGPDGCGEIVAGPLGYANGLALSAGEQRLFMVESDADRVLEIDLGSGRAAGYAEGAGRFPDGLAPDRAGNLYVSCYASGDIHRIGPTGAKMLFAYDPWAILLGRRSITRARTGCAGKPLANEL